MKRQLLNDQYHGQQPPQEWEAHLLGCFLYMSRSGIVDLWRQEEGAPTSAVFAPAIAWQGLRNARLDGWAV